MKRVLSLYLLGIAVAACCTACVKGGGGGGTSPDPVPSGPPNQWSGTARFTRDFEVEDDLLESSSTFTVDVVNVTWAKDANPNPAPPAGGARYVVASGILHAFYRENVRFSGGTRCTSEWSGVVQVPTAAPFEGAQGSVLEVKPDGQYEGELYEPVIVEYVKVCSNGPQFVVRSAFYLDLDITGTLEGGRMRGEMAPRVLRTEGVTSTNRGSWDFAGN